jgi:hypothetical protein
MHCCGAVYPAPGAKPMPAAREPSASPQERLCFLLGAPRSSVALRPGWSPAFPGKQYDIARRTVWRTGLTRFIAVCLRSGYGWLSVGGVLTWRFASVLAGPYYDAMLHAIFVGFVVTMIFGHAPIILPAILGRTRRRIQERWGYTVDMPPRVPDTGCGTPGTTSQVASIRG